MKPYDSAPLLALYATSGCHLCEQAAALLRAAVDAPFRLVEIAVDDDLLERYGVRIPVVVGDGAVLCEGRLDASAVRAFLDRYAPMVGAA